MAVEQTPEAERYENLIAAFAARGVRAEFHRAGQLVVCLDEPVLAGRIWITWQGQWFISTWAPAVYPVPDGADIVAICMACLEWRSSGHFWTIPDEIAGRFGLQIADDENLPEWFTGDVDEAESC